MPTTINYALKYADKVDERFTLGSLTAGLLETTTLTGLVFRPFVCSAVT